MDTVTSWGNLFLEPLQDLSSQVLSFLPQLLSALVILIVGKIVVGIIIKILKRVLGVLPIDSVLEKTGVSGELAKVGITTPLSAILAGVIGLFLKLIVWIAVIDVLSIEQLTIFLDKIVLYIPNVFVAVIILAAGVTIAKVVQGLVEKSLGSVAAAKASAETGAKIAKYSILAFTVIATLSQLGIAQGLLDTLFSGIVGALAIALGISFGLGGKDKAAEVISNLSK